MSTLADANLQLAIYTATGRLMDKRIEIRRDGRAARLPGTAHAGQRAQEAHHREPRLLPRSSSSAMSRRTAARWSTARTASEVADFVLELAKERGAKLIVKSKSMTTEEIDLNERLEHHGLEVGRDRPRRVHPAARAREAVSHRRAGAAQDALRRGGDLHRRSSAWSAKTVIEKQTVIARAVLREKFLAADIGISGANFLVADSGAVVHRRERGQRAPDHLRAEDPHRGRRDREGDSARAGPGGVSEAARPQRHRPAAHRLHLVPLAGRGAPGEVDGPEEFYVVLLDNGRTKLLADREKRQSLYCIRCGACLNTCPVYRKIGGHSFPWVYSGPIGAIITPQFMGVAHEPGAAVRIQPVRRVRRGLPGQDRHPQGAAGTARATSRRAETRERQNRLEKLAFRAFAWVMTASASI